MKLMKPDYSNSILNVSHTILAHYGHKTDLDLIPELKEVLNKNYKHVFLFILDGMGTNIVKKDLKRQDFLRKYVVKKITSIYPPTTVAATHAILTAKSPYESGYLGWTQYFPDEDIYDIIFLNKDYYDSSKKIDINLKDKYLKHKTIFDYIEQANQKVKTYGVFPSFVKDGFETFDDELERALEISHMKEDTFTYVYWINPDDKEHKFGPMSKEVKEEIKSLSNKIQIMSQKLGESSLLIIMADHGQIEVKPIEFTNDSYLYEMFEKKPSLEPRTPAFFVKAEKRLEFENIFRKTYGKRYKLYASADFIESGLIGSGIKHPMLDKFVGDFVGVAISDRYLKFKKEAIYKGHHAGLTKGEMEVPLIIFEK